MRLGGSARERQGVGVGRVHLHQQGGVPPHVDLRDRRRDIAQPLGHAQRRRIQELDRGETETGEVGQCGHGGGQRLEHEQPGRDRGAYLDRAEARLGDEGERALRADHECSRMRTGSSKSSRALRP